MSLHRPLQMFEEDSSSGDEGPQNSKVDILEAQSRQIEKEDAAELADAQYELQEQYEEEMELLTLPTAQELEQEAQVPDVRGIRLRMEVSIVNFHGGKHCQISESLVCFLNGRNDIRCLDAHDDDYLQALAEALGDYRNRCDTSQSRRAYVQQFIADVCSYFGYTQELAELLSDLFTPAEALDFFGASDANRPLVIRVNTLKTRRKDLQKASDGDALAWGYL